MALTLPSIIISLIALIFGLGLTAWLFSSTDSTWAKRIGISTLGTILGFLLARTTETWLEAQKSYEASARALEQVESMQSSISKLNTYLGGITKARELIDSPFRALVQRELEDLDDRLLQITRGDLRLKREEIIPRWEFLIRASKKTIDATNIVSEKDWVEFSPNSGIEVHEYAIKNNVRIRRIMIYDETDVDHVTGIKRLSKPQAKIGIDLRMISIQWIQQSSFLSELMRDIGTVDVVIYDSHTVLLTTVDGQKRMLSSKFGTDPHLIKKAVEFYEKLWDSSAKINL